jgi:hypothetical protein
MAPPGRGAGTAAGGRAARRKPRRARHQRVIRNALSYAVADGIQRYVPSSIGIFAVGLPLCGIASFIHFVLGGSVFVTGATSGSISAASVLGWFFHLD